MLGRELTYVLIAVPDCNWIIIIANNLKGRNHSTIEQERKNHNTIQIDLTNEVRTLTRSP